MKTFDVIAIGEPLVEFNQTRKGEPTYVQGFGGDTSNAVIAAARQGARTTYITRVGDDAWGRMLLALWRSEGVDASAVDIDPHAATGVYFVTHGDAGHAFSYLREGSAASRMRPESLPRALLEGARFVAASAISLAISPTAADTVLAAFDVARRAGAAIAFDPNVRLRLWPLPRAKALIDAATAAADYVFPSLDDAQVLTGLADPHAIVDRFHHLGAKNVLLKLGAEGVIASDGKATLRIEGHRVDAVDATGAGDCFCGAFLARLAAGDDLAHASRYANAAAALATTGFGAVAPLPRPDAVRKLLG